MRSSAQRADGEDRPFSALERKANHAEGGYRPCYAQLRSAEAAYEEARRQRDEAVIKMARVDGLNNREIAARVELTAERVAQILKKGG